MPWKEISIEKLAESLGVSIAEVREKQHLIQKLIKARKSQGLTQAALAKILGVSQSWIAQVESGVGTSRVTFDALLNILSNLGYDFKIVTQKAA
ncbi:MAG: helix-turn-helix domain-containing protein [Deltaproteobacteria bacterium]|nr:helix-turn-helix domain-containing protein [Deltaproteobacteria bacterium]